MTKELDTYERDGKGNRLVLKRKCCLRAKDFGVCHYNPHTLRHPPCEQAFACGLYPLGKRTVYADGIALQVLQDQRVLFIGTAIQEKD